MNEMVVGADKMLRLDTSLINLNQTDSGFILPEVRVDDCEWVGLLLETKDLN